MAQAGRIPVYINFVEATYARDVQVSATRNQKVHKFANGKRDRSQGQPEYQVQLTFSIPEERAQFIQQAEGGLDDDNAVGFTFSYDKGQESWMILNCGISQDNNTSDQDGTADQQLTLVGTDRQRIL